MDLTISGRHALLFDDDATAAFVSSPAALVPWVGDAALLIDRYDVRHLLDRIPARRPRASPLREPDIDLERYLDLPDCERDGDQHSETIKGSEATNSGAFQAVPLFYGNDDSMTAPKDSDSGPSSIFYPPFDVPENLVNNLPPTEKLHQIIARTAMFVSNHGGQSEIVLRVKQGDNPTFGFLMPDNRLHVYFRYLVDHPELVNGSTCARETQEKASENQDNKAHIAAAGALSMLGSVYDSEEEDDYAVGHPQSKEMMSDKSNVPGDPVMPLRLKSEECSTSAVSEDKKTSKAANGKERILLPKRNPVVNFASFSVPRSNKEGDDHASTRVVKPVIVEPPSALKEAIDKIIEFILRNGKQFEAVLTAQDKTAGRFPFLLPSNQYHPYYLKLLEEAQESKLMGDNLSHHKHDAHGHGGSKKRRRDSPQKGTDSNDSNLADKSGACGVLINGKCKTLIGVAKNDAHDDQPPAHGRQSSLSSDEVAAIIMAATRGSSPANTVQRPTSARQSGASADEAAAIVLAATRGLTPDDVDQPPISVKPHGWIADESHTTIRGLSPAKEGLTREDSGRASSIRSLSPFEGNNPLSRSVSKGEADKSLPAASSLPTGKHDTVGSVTESDVLLAKVIANTVACAASNEASSSEACLTKEQRQKAERLKRAKMFAAVIKSGTSSVTEFVRSSSVPSGSLVDSNADSIRSSTKMDFVNQEREVSLNSEISDKVKSQGNDDREKRSRKTYRTTNRDHVDEDSDEERNTSRKKHRSKDSPLRSRDHHRHQKYPYTSGVKESRHRKHQSSPEDDYKHNKRSSYRRRYMDDSSENDDDERIRSDVHRRKHQAQLAKKTSSEVDSRVKTSVHVDAKVPAASDAQQSDAAEVPCELRAKIRAMLLETL